MRFSSMAMATWATELGTRSREFCGESQQVKRRRLIVRRTIWISTIGSWIVTSFLVHVSLISEIYVCANVCALQTMTFRKYRTSKYLPKPLVFYSYSCDVDLPHFTVACPRGISRSQVRRWVWHGATPCQPTEPCFTATLLSVERSLLSKMRA